jgi:Zn-dependent peptidase ImmA (M78 family)/transcriptional regulator with XRE-family HTH domain
VLSHVLTDAEVGRRVKEARSHAGYASGVKFAQVAGLTQSTLSRIEAGKRAVTVSELARIAALVGRPPESFLEPAPSAGALFRLPPEVDLNEDALKTVGWLEKFAYRVKALREFTPGAEIPKPQVLRRDAPQSFPEAVIAAEDVRSALGLGSAPVPDMVELLEGLGCLVVVRPLGKGGPDAAYVPRPLGIVLLNGSHARVRQRFTMAHELAHHVFHGGFVTVELNIYDPHGRSEQFCNTFAAYFLMPSSGIASELRRRFGLGRPQKPEHAFWLAIHFGVSLEAMCYQLQNLRLISLAIARDWREQDRRQLQYGLGMIDFRQRPPVERRWPPEFLERLRYAVDEKILDRAQVKRHLESDTQAVLAVLAPA